MTGRQLDPAIAFLADALAAARPEIPPEMAERRRISNETMLLARQPLPPDVKVEDHTVAVAGGEIAVRIHRPEGLDAPAPAFFFLHGGGWIQGDLNTAEVECGPLAATVPTVVVLAEYRLAPENPFPVPLEDSYAAYEWLVGEANQLGVDAERIAVGGTSAGGNLAAAMCLLARERSTQMPCAQILDAPCLDLTLASASLEDVGDGFGLTAADVAEFVDLYTPVESTRRDPLASPLLAENLAGLPPACVVTAEFDPLRDDGERYVARLHEDGVRAAGFRVLGHIHGSWIVPVGPVWHLVGDIRADALRRAFAGTFAD